MNDLLCQVGMEDISNYTGRKETSHRIDSCARKELEKCLWRFVSLQLHVPDTFISTVFIKFSSLATIISPVRLEEMFEKGCEKI